jgi:hypothetical protein
VYALAAWAAWRAVRRSPLALLPVLWVLAFWCVHVVFEVQGRYFASMLLLAPVITALALGRARAVTGPSPAGTTPDTRTP